jgi:hypothetical protein
MFAKQLVALSSLTTLFFFLLAADGVSAVAVDGHSTHHHAGVNASHIQELVERGGSKKVMLAWGLGNDKSIHNAIGSKTGAIHTWSLSQPSATKNLGLKFFPTIWGKKDIGKIASSLKGANGDVTVLTFNEPQERGQSNLSPETAASLWKQHIQPLRKKGYKLCCPATSGNPNGITWMDNFFKACKGGCTCDYMGVHFYDTTATKLKAWVNRWRKYKKPLIISEFADHNFNGPQQPNNDQVWQFYTSAIPWLHAQKDIAWYAPFGWFLNHNEGGVQNNVLLLKSNHHPSPLGSYVKNYRPT